MYHTLKTAHCTAFKEYSTMSRDTKLCTNIITVQSKFLPHPYFDISQSHFVAPPAAVD